MYARSRSESKRGRGDAASERGVGERIPLSGDGESGVGESGDVIEFRAGTMVGWLRRKGEQAEEGLSTRRMKEAL